MSETLMFVKSTKQKVAAKLLDSLREVYHYQRFLVLVCALMAYVSMMAQTSFVVGKLKYTVLSETEKTVSVCKNEIQDKQFIIPATVKNNGIPYSVTEIAERAFFNCDELNSVAIPNSVTTIDNDAFNGSRRLVEVSIGNSVVSIGESAFRECHSLTSVGIPNSVTTIGDWAFFECSALPSVSIGNSVNKIGSYAFARSSMLKKIESKNPTPPIANDNILYVNDYENCVLVVPVGSKQLYENASTWKTFPTIEEKDFTGGTSGISNITETGSTIAINGNAITATADVNVAVFTIDGQMVARSSLRTGESITLPIGTYVVNANDKAVKIVIR